MSPTTRPYDPFYGFKPGQVLATKYRLLVPIAAGGMGQVWAARNLATGAEIAIKLLLPERSPSAVARFRREAHATAQLCHRGIVRVFDLLDLPDSDGSVAIVMERLRGKTLAEHLENEGALGVEKTLSIMLPILGALHHAHGFGVIHRDLKPENIFLSIESDGAVIPKLLDFGVSKALRSTIPPVTFDGLIVGTPSHMSPEQMRGADVDARSDIFSAGILLHICLTGRNPFAPADDSLEALVEAVATLPEPPQNVPPAVWAVIARALAAREEDRFASAAELSLALAAAAAEPTEVTAAVLTPTSALVGGSVFFANTRRRVSRIALAASFVAISLAAFGASSSRRPAQRSGADRATRTVRAEPQLLVPSADTLLPAELSPGSLVPPRQPAAREAPSSFVVRARSFTREQVPQRKLLVLRDPGF